jgi:hypothetical protein
VAAAYFIDSSGLVKRYVREDGTGCVRRLTRRNPSTVIYIARITAVEVTSAVARRWKGKTVDDIREIQRFSLAEKRGDVGMTHIEANQRNPRQIWSC